MTVCLNAVPYPEVTGGNDPETVALLKEDYAGAGGELTGISQYIFQNTVTKDDAFANAMLQIAIVEMTHLDMLGDAIETLGGDPKFENGGQFWQASFINYAMSMEEMLAANIQAETGAILSYQRHAEQTRNASVRALLLRIIDDEREHLRFFNDMYTKMRSGGL